MKTNLVELIVEAIYDFLRRTLKGRLIVLGLLALFFTGCNSKDSGGSADFSDVLPPDSGTPVTLTVRSGSGFDCLIADGRVFCRGSSANVDLAISAVEFEEYFADANSDVTAFKVWDDTLCVETQVLDRPYNGGPGYATYCFGERTLGAQVGADPVIYSGPMFSTAAHGSADLSYTVEPFAGGDVYITNFDSYVTDGVGSVNESAVGCLLSADGTLIECPNFEVVL